MIKVLFKRWLFRKYYKRFHIVKEGEHLYTICAQHKAQIDDVMVYNEIEKPHRISVGEGLIIPVCNDEVYLGLEKKINKLEKEIEKHDNHKDKEQHTDRRGVNSQSLTTNTRKKA